MGGCRTRRYVPLCRFSDSQTALQSAAPVLLLLQTPLCRIPPALALVCSATCPSLPVAAAFRSACIADDLTTFYALNITIIVDLILHFVPHMPFSMISVIGLSHGSYAVPGWRRVVEALAVALGDSAPPVAAAALAAAYRVVDALFRCAHSQCAADMSAHALLLASRLLLVLAFRITSASANASMTNSALFLCLKMGLNVMLLSSGGSPKLEAGQDVVAPSPP